ncbi:MAG: peptide deformylase [Acidobacteriota bacterium]
MPVLKILTYGSPVLKKKAEPVQRIDQEITDIARSMVLTMHAAPGIGLAGPQVNVSKRLITIDLSIGEKPEELIILVNPELVESEGEIVSEEGCLSIPEIHEKVKRPARVLVKGLNLQGEERTFEAEGLLARVFCHEIDHINGRLFIENISALKRALIKKRLQKKLEIG